MVQFKRFSREKFLSTSGSHDCGILIRSILAVLLLKPLIVFSIFEKKSTDISEKFDEIVTVYSIFQI